jgi:hypothetical protein
VLNHALSVLLAEIQEPRWHENALKLIHPLRQDFVTSLSLFSDRRTCDLALKCCCHLLEAESDTLGDDQVQSKSVANLIRVIANHAFDSPVPLPHTQTQFDLLVDNLLRICICEGTGDEAINDTFPVLAWLGGSPSTQDRMRRYIDMIIRFMGQKNTCYSALRAACAVGSTVTSMGQDDESFREHFSEALFSAVLLDAPQTSINDSPFTDLSFFFSPRHMP